MKTKKIKATKRYPIRVSTYSLEDGRHIYVVRDDKIPGGTKLRVLLEWMPSVGPHEFVFAAPAQGYAQVALAMATEMLGEGYSITLFEAERKQLHPRTQLAIEHGANMHYVSFGMLTNVQARAREYAQARVRAYLLPIGLEAPGVLDTITRQARTLGWAPREVWTVVGGGTLNRGLQAAWPDADFHAVQVGHKADVGRATRWSTGVPYDRKAPVSERPPFPSIANNDAKAWKFIVKHASDEALFWNVAGDDY